MAADTFENVIRFLFSWSDRTLDCDWRSTYEPVGTGSAERDEDMRSLTRRYLAMRRRADGWRPRRYDMNNHKAIPNADVLALLADARALDHGDRPGVQGRPGRPSNTEGRTRECRSCGGRFRARRSTARYCGGTCRERARRGRNRDGNERGNHGSKGLATRTPAEGRNGAVSVTEGA